ncbi:MAG: glycogen/starch synthase, partial [Pseudomonadota bacterium]
MPVSCWSHRTCSASSCTSRASARLRHTVNNAREIVFIAAENGALPGGKVGGVGDVARDLPRALARAGWTVTVL